MICTHVSNRAEKKGTWSPLEAIPLPGVSEGDRRRVRNFGAGACDVFGDDEAER